MSIAPDDVEKKKSNRTLFIAFFTIFLDLVGFGIIIPVQPFYAEIFGASPTQVTWLGASYSLMQFLFAPLWGRLSDRIGRRPVLMSGIFISIIGYTLFGAAGSLPVLFIARMLAGFGNANIGVAQALVADVTSRENRAKGMGIIGAAFGLGFTFGPAIGGLLGQISPQAPGYGAAILGAINLVLAWRFLPETVKLKALSESANETSHQRKVPLSFSALRRAAAIKNVLPILVTTLTVITGFALMEQIMGLYIERVWLGGQPVTPESAKHATALTAAFLVAVGITATIVQGGLVGRLVKKYGELLLCKFGIIVLVFAMLVTPVFVESKSLLLLLLCAVLYAVGMGLFNPSITSLLSKNVSESDQGGTLGLNQSMSSLGRFLGPAVAGVLFERQVNLPFYSSAALIGLSFFLVLRIKK
jgi:DHA1 family tetracycline resistance protein-like MFS transporter